MKTTVAALLDTIRKRLVMLVLMTALGALGFVTSCSFLGPKTYYGPPPVDRDPPPNKEESVDKPAEAPKPEPRCEPVSVYGPKPCASDDECVEEYGDGWYCDEEHGYDDGCGGKIDWPVCKN